MKVAAFLVFAFGCIVAAILSFLPASLVDRRIDAASQGKLRLADASGTVWKGRGLLTDSAGTWRVPVGWSIAKADVLRGIHALSLRPVDGASAPQGSVEWVDDGVRIRGLAAEAPAQALAWVLPARALPTLGGTIFVSGSQFAWNAKESSGTLDAHWRGARLVAGDVVADLGTVDLALAPQDKRLSGRLTNSGGEVRIDGTLTITVTDINVDATIAPAPDAPPQIARALASLGTPGAGGSVRITWRGPLR